MHDAFARMVIRESPVVSEIIMTIIMQRKKAKKKSKEKSKEKKQRKKAKKTGTIVLSPLELRNLTPRALGVHNFYIC